ncbi:GDSL lipase/esterase [Dillenia turbinata]|uniref:GDSL lipase/esterase n=1 Tax=Dillenia turbinata TaxID=194707 RepID=A0AAN8UFG6_9MAGN
MENLSHFIVTFLVILTTSVLVCPVSCIRKNVGGATLFVFGDSLFDPGNNQYRKGGTNDSSNNWPYGESYFKHATGRLSDGRLVPDFIAEFMKLPICIPYLRPGAHRFTQGANFASAGAGVLVQTNPDTSINLQLQLGYFKELEKTLRQELGVAETKKTFGRAIYLFSIGGNDYFNFYNKHPNSNQAQRTQFLRMVIGNFTHVLKEVYEMGGRKFGFQNAGPLGCAPLMRANNTKSPGHCIDEPSAMARLHNRALPKVLKDLQNKLPGFKYSTFDYYNSLIDRIKNPSKYGLKEGKSACCGRGAYRAMLYSCGQGQLGKDYELCSNPKEYVHFDCAHTTEATNLQLAKLLWEGPPTVTSPLSLKDLLNS